MKNFFKKIFNISLNFLKFLIKILQILNYFFKNNENLKLISFTLNSGKYNYNNDN